MFTIGTAITRVTTARDKPVINDSPIITPSPTPINVTPTSTAVPTNSPTPTARITPKATATPTKIPNVTLSNKCIVTLFGSLYDVTSLRSTHSGGDIFNCGTDMTAIYQGRHGNNLSRMAAYLYDPNNPNKVIVAPAGSGRRERFDDD